MALLCSAQNQKFKNDNFAWVYFVLFCFFTSHLACDEERVEAAKLLVEHGASIYIENKEEKTPLQLAKGGLGMLLQRIVEGWWIYCVAARVSTIIIPSSHSVLPAQPDVTHLDV